MVEKQSGTIRTVAWSEIFPWLSIVRAFRLAIALRCSGARRGGRSSDGTRLGADWCPTHVGTGSRLPANPVARMARAMSLAGDNHWLRCPDAASVFLIRLRSRFTEWQQTETGRSFPWVSLTQPAWSAFPARAFACGCGMHDFVRAGGRAVWAFFGAAICRTAAVRLAADEQVGLARLLRYACRKWPAYFAAPCCPSAACCWR